MERDTIPVQSRFQLKKNTFWVLYLTLQALLVAVAFLAGFLFHQWFAPKSGDFPMLQRALTILDQHAYYELPDEKQLEYGMIRGMLQVYNDPYTVFVEPPQAELQANQLEGKFGGIGVRMEYDQENLLYIYPLPDSSALKAGLLEGDRLLKVDDLSITPETPLDTIQAAIRGPVGEKVRITVGRSPDYAPITYSVVRAEVPLPSVTWNLAASEDQVGVVQINVIADTTPDEVTKAIQDLQQRGAEYFVIDVRNNGGGLVEAGVNTARLFLAEGSVIEEQYRDQPVQSFTVEKPGLFADLPLAILVNHGTASAAEIFAGALQGQDRARLVGSPTYGKDSIQLIFDLEDGSSLHVTAARWWIPGLDGELKGTGLQPDQVIADDDPNTTPLQTAINLLLSR